MRTTALRGLVIAAGYLAALVAAAACVAVRYIWVDPRDVAASSGMYAFGDFIEFLVFGGLFSLVPTFFLLRMLRQVERFWRALSWMCLALAVEAPLVWLLYQAVARGGQEHSAGAALLSLFVLLRGFSSPAIFLGIAVAWIMCAPWPAIRRRLVWSLAFEAVALLSFGAWFAAGLFQAR
jgi:hypothetical protein